MADDDKVFIVGEDGVLTEITRNLIFSIPVPDAVSKDKDEEDENELSAKGNFFKKRIDRTVFDLPDTNFVITTEASTTIDDLEQPSSSSEWKISITNDSEVKSSKQLGLTQNTKRTLLWKKGELEAQDTSFKGETSLSDEELNLVTPFDYFFLLFSSELFQNICDQSSLYSTQLDSSKSVDVNVNDLKKYLGTCLLTSVMTAKNVSY